MIEIAYDLDGVLMPDYDHFEGHATAEFYSVINHAQPLFHPEGEYDIVTARPERDRIYTETWARKLKTPPRNIIMKTTDYLEENSAEYKYRTIKENRYRIYIESDYEIVQEIKRLALIDSFNECQVFHLHDFVVTAIANVAI